MLVGDLVCPRLGRFGGGVLLLGLWEVCFGKHILKSRFWEAPPPEYMGSGGYRSGAAGGSAWGRPRSRLLPFVEMLLLLFVSKTLYVSLFVHV